jgi:hypothetical protein
MTHINKKIFKLALFASGFLITCSGYGMNLLQPYDTLLRPPYGTHDTDYHLNVFIETGFGTRNYGSDGSVNNPLQIWQIQQNGLSMLQGFDPSSAPGQLLSRIDANDDGVRGHFCVSGDLDLRAAFSFGARYFFHKDWFVSADMPFYSERLSSVQFVDLTLNNNDADYRTKTLLTNNFATNVAALGGPIIGPWERTGPGDLAILVNWFRNFPQDKEYLKNARLNFRLGVSFPTGKRWDPDLLFALPFGYDGAFAMPFGFGLDLTFGRYVMAGLDVQLTQIFGNTECRRIKTAFDQTELILLQKTQAYKNFGLIQRFNLYIEFYKILRGFSAMFGYKYLKQGNSYLELNSNAFSNTIANSAESLKYWTEHEFIINASYDVSEHLREDAPVFPYISLYTVLPFNGKRAALFRRIGFVAGFDF